MLAVSGGVLAVAVALAVLVAGTLRHDGICITEPATFPDRGVEGWSGEQLENAATIVLTARDRGLGVDAQVLGVMTAMGESSLRNIDYGDWETSGITNPDGSRTSSIGLFQQQDWWGSPEERMDPATASGLFYDRLVRVPGWQDAEPTAVIHRVQVNADPDFYERFESDATAVVEALSEPCTPPAP
ncbi:MAG: hypothetical protein ACQEW8_13710 [Actinomycetota bacterium]